MQLTQGIRADDRVGLRRLGNRLVLPAILLVRLLPDLLPLLRTTDTAPGTTLHRYLRDC
jgi:hypothetical protein